MTIECTVLAKTGDEVGEGTMAYVQLLKGGWIVWLWMNDDVCRM